MALKVTDEPAVPAAAERLEYHAEGLKEMYDNGIISTDELAAEYEGRVEIGKVDVDDNDDIVSEYGIRNIPTVLFFKDGELVDKQVGAAGKETFIEKINKLL